MSRNIMEHWNLSGTKKHSVSTNFVYHKTNVTKFRLTLFRFAQHRDFVLRNLH